jgi:hypothetical protein
MVTEESNLAVDQSRSTLTRLFIYSKDEKFSAHENYTTEALAACIRSDPTPMLAVLRDRLIGSQGAKVVEGATWARAQTQVYLLGGSILDLHLTVGDETRITGEVWIEAKIGAPLTSAQLLGYVDSRHRMVARGDATPRAIVALGPVSPSEVARRELEAVTRPLDSEHARIESIGRSVGWISWRDIYRVARQSTDPWWRDLRLFLEETDVTDAALLPITDREAGSLGDASQLIRKVGEVIRQVNREILRIWGAEAKLAWTAEGGLLNHIGAMFLQRGSMIWDGTVFQVGAIDIDGNSYWYLGVVAAGRSGAEIDAILAEATRRGMRDDWRARPSERVFLWRSVRIAERTTHEAAVAWFTEGLLALRDSGVVDAVRRTQTVRSGPEAGTNSDGA